MGRPLLYANARKCEMRMEAQLYDKLKHIAAQEGRSLNGEISYLAKKAVEEYEKIYGPIMIDTPKKP